MTEKNLRKCTICKIEKEAKTGNFYPSKHGKYGLQSVCQGCHLTQKTEHYEINSTACKMSELNIFFVGDSYLCDDCQYLTKDASNMWKHINTKKHLRKIIS